MGLITELEPTSPISLVRENSESSLSLLKKYILEQGGLNQETCMQIVPQICRNLQIQSKEWDWLSVAESHLAKAYQLELAVSCLEYGIDDDDDDDGELQLQLMQAISLYINEHVPWSNPQLSSICMALDKKNCGANLVRFADLLQPRFLSVSGQKFATVVSARRGGKSRFTKTRVTRPRLGLQIASATEENERTTWKQSTDVTALSSAVLLMACDGTSQYAAMCASFILNVLDDPEPLFRAQGCFLLQYLVGLGHGNSLVQTGLVSVFEESVKTCLTYLPQLTPPEVSLHLLEKGAYPALFSLLKLNEHATYVEYLEILDAHLLASISHVSGRNSDAVTNSLLAFFFSQISQLIQQNLRLSILACFSRLNFVLCQTISNPYLIESENGDSVVEAALTVQLSILSICHNHEDAQARTLILQYKYDFLGSWAILGKRIVKYGVGSSTTRKLVLECLALLTEMANNLDLKEMEHDLHVLKAKVPELQQIF